jgi:PAS domain-containing protein
VPPHLLIAGPESESRRKLSGLLARHYEVGSCRPEDLGEDREPPPDLLLILGDTPGLQQLIRRLKGLEAFRQVAVIVAFPEFSAVAAAWALEAGADEFLLPPFRGGEVLGRLAVVLRLLDDRRLLVSSQEEFSRLFQETGHPLFFCDRAGAVCKVNPALRRLLGYPGRRGVPVAMDMEELLFGPEERQRFRQLVAQGAGASHLKLRLRHREGHPVTVLLSDLARPDRPPELLSFEVKPVGPHSPLKQALQGLVDHLFPSARDYLALLQMTPLLGGRYEKVKKLGQGNFGEVWLVADTEAAGKARYYVAKIPFLKAANPKFRKEAAICQKLAPHPGVVKLIDTVEDEGKLVLIQEYAAGPTLSERLDRELSRPLVERVILQLIKILGEKDISGTMVGSRPFMAPEQIMGKSERRSDIWAIGVLMYLLYTGELPFYREVEKLLIDQILEQEPEPPRKLNPEIPPALEAIILQCLKKNLEERYASAVALKTDLLRRFPHYGTQAGRWPWIQ